jgi:DUF4097 and DUF4098 domain-containing protein YvlB
MKRGSLGIGLALCAAGVVLALAPNVPTLVGWAARWWPLAPIALGLASLVGFAARRRPRSPLRGAAMLVFGGLSLAVTLQSAPNPVAFYGRFWPILLAVVALVSVLRYYSYRPESGEPRPALFGAGKLSLVGLIVISGLAANRLAEANPNLLARVSMPAGLEHLRDELFGEEFAFAPLTASAPLPASGVVTVTNRYGDVAVEAVDGDAVEVTVTPSVRAYERGTAERVASQLRLAVEASGPGLGVGTNRAEIEHELTTNMRVRVPRRASLRIEQSHGRVAVSGIAADGATLTIDASHAPVDIRGVRAAIEIKDARAKVAVTDSSGSLNVLGRNDVSVSKFAGAVRLEDSDSVRLEDLAAPTVDLVSVDHARVAIENVAGGSLFEDPAKADGVPIPDGVFDGRVPTRVTIEGAHTSVSLKSIFGDVTVKTTHDDVKATGVSGALEVEASHSKVEATSVGSLKVRTDHEDVRAKDVAGTVDVENDHGGVFVSNFQADCSVRTSFDSVKLEAAGRQAGDVRVENARGKIDVRLPAGQAYRVEHEVERGDVRIDRAFEQAASGGTVYRVVLKTTHDDITVRPLAGRAGDKDPA